MFILTKFSTPTVIKEYNTIPDIIAQIEHSMCKACWRENPEHEVQHSIDRAIYNQSHNLVKLQMLLNCECGMNFIVDDRLQNIMNDFVKSPTTKICGNCCSDQLSLFQSNNEKICTSCHTKIEWTLAENQQPLVSNNRVKATQKFPNQNEY